MHTSPPHPLTTTALAQLRHWIPGLAIALYLLTPHSGLSQGPRITFSVDVQGPTAGFFGNDGLIRDSFYDQEIDGGDILTIGTPGQPLPPEPNIAARGPVTAPPGIVVFGIDQGVPNSRSLGLDGVLVGSRPELEVEIDALSFGHDSGRGIFFSVDEFSHGLPPSDVADQALGFQASADIFRWLEGPDQNVLAIDGAGGERPNQALGLGLLEPNPPDTVEFDFGDNLDALNVNTDPADLGGPIFFSLDASFPDPAEPLNPPQGPNIGSAEQNGVSGADILISLPGQPIQVFIPAQQLGLDPVADDVDALALIDADQDQVFDQFVDNLFFSVRRGSQIIGQLDPFSGQRITAGDILTLPHGPNEPPVIVLPAEALGLNVNRGEFGGGIVRPIDEPLPDDLDALALGLQDGDMNCNGEWDREDVGAFALALEDSVQYEEVYNSVCFGLGADIHGDLNMDFRFGFQDIEHFVRVISNSGVLDEAEIAGIIQDVPEPSSATIMAWFVLALAYRRSRFT